jgi:hypothetical protein
MRTTFTLIWLIILVIITTLANLLALEIIDEPMVLFYIILVDLRSYYLIKVLILEYLQQRSFPGRFQVS